MISGQTSRRSIRKVYIWIRICAIVCRFFAGSDKRKYKGVFLILFMVRTMIQKNPKTSWMDPKTPKIDSSAYIHPSAVVIGDVSIRGDEGGPIVLGSGSNVQDHVVMHGLKGEAIIIGQEVCVAHAAVVHGPCTIGDHSFIGFGATIFKANIGSGCFVSTKALVTGVDLPDGKFVTDAQVVDSLAKIATLGDVPEPQRELATEVVEVNKEFAQGYRLLER
jgi:carbonic anhydrase/acetyltransferase-like protein (isoleucine patch superfamily)